MMSRQNLKKETNNTMGIFSLFKRGPSVEEQFLKIIEESQNELLQNRKRFEDALQKIEDDREKAYIKMIEETFPGPENLLIRQFEIMSFMVQKNR